MHAKFAHIIDNKQFARDGRRNEMEIQQELEFHKKRCNRLYEQVQQLEKIEYDFNESVRKYHAQCFGWIDYFEQKPQDNTWIFTQDIYGQVRFQYYISNSAQEDMIDINQPDICNSQLYKGISRFRYWMNSPVFTKPELPTIDLSLYKQTIAAMKGDE